MARKTLPYYPLYVDDFDEDPKVLRMTLAEVGLYQLALNESWKRGSIPEDSKELARMIRRPADAVADAYAAVRACWVANGEPGRLVNPRQEKERAKAAVKSSQATEAARARYANGNANAVADAYASADIRASVSINTSIAENTSTTEKPLRRKRSEVLWKSDRQRACFDEFWAAYWRRVDKHGASKVYAARILTEKNHVAVMAGVAAQTPGMLGRDPENRPHAATWLNHERWTDEVSNEVFRPKTRMEKILDSL